MSIEDQHPHVHVKAWNHRRKGRIVGTVVRKQDEWWVIRLIGDQHLHMASASMDGRHLDGDEITVRADWLTEVPLSVPDERIEP